VGEIKNRDSENTLNNEIDTDIIVLLTGLGKKSIQNSRNNH
jgi:hypothetical protein